jgi:hypothetical protein
MVINDHVFGYNKTVVHFSFHTQNTTVFYKSFITYVPLHNLFLMCHF